MNHRKGLLYKQTAAERAVCAALDSLGVRYVRQKPLHTAGGQNVLRRRLHPQPALRITLRRSKTLRTRPQNFATAERRVYTAHCPYFFSKCW